MVSCRPQTGFRASPLGRSRARVGARAAHRRGTPEQARGHPAPVGCKRRPPKRYSGRWVPEPTTPRRVRGTGGVWEVFVVVVVGVLVLYVSPENLLTFRAPLPRRPVAHSQRGRQHRAPHTCTYGLPVRHRLPLVGGSEAGAPRWGSVSIAIRCYKPLENERVVPLYVSCMV